jgi:hypothetical protein
MPFFLTLFDIKWVFVLKMTMKYFSFRKGFEKEGIRNDAEVKNNFQCCLKNDILILLSAQPIQMPL